MQTINPDFFLPHHQEYLVGGYFFVPQSKFFNSTGANSNS